MNGNSLYKSESSIQLYNGSLKSLFLLYAPLCGKDAVYLYLYLCVNPSFSFRPVNDLLLASSFSIDTFEEALAQLNKVCLVSTLKHEIDDRYLFSIRQPNTVEEFVKDDILSRKLIKKIGHISYQEILSSFSISTSHHSGFSDISLKDEPDVLNEWNLEDESYLRNSYDQDIHISSIFDLDGFLKECSLDFFPMRYRTPDILEDITAMADLYGLNFDQLRLMIPKILDSRKNGFDKDYFHYLCRKEHVDYKDIKKGDYDIPSNLFLMHQQGGRELTPADNKILLTLSRDYLLSAPVINVLLEYALDKCDNRLFDNFLYKIASDLHRNNISDSQSAVRFLNHYSNNDSPQPLVYDDSKNPVF